MPLGDVYIRDEACFTTAQRLAGKAFSLQRRLPEQVFRGQFTSFLFDNFDWLLSMESWPSLKALARKSSDSVVIMGILEPDPVGYYHRNLGYYNWALIPTALTSDEYNQVLELHPDGHLADAILYNSFTAFWLSPSLKWGIWGERGCEIGVLGLAESFIDEDLRGILREWMHVDDALGSWIPQGFRQGVPNAFSTALRENYHR